MQDVQYWSAQSSALGQPITEAERDRTLAYLQQAYAEGRIQEVDLDQRVGQALIARNRHELNQSFAGLARVPLHTQAVARSPLYDTLVGRPANSAPLAGRLAHWSGLFSSFFGPGIIYALSPRDSLTSREAARAFNFQLSILAGWIIAGILDRGIVAALVSFIWLFGTIAGGIWASRGDDSRKLRNMTPLQVLNDGSRRRPRAIGR